MGPPCGPAGRLGPRLPRLVVPAARQRVRAEMAGVILPANRWRLARHAEHRRRQGIRLNVNVLGEAILGEDEAEQRLQRVLDVLAQPAVDYVSVKISSISSQLDVLRFDREVERLAARLRRLYDAANGYRPAKFVNLDMEEYRDLELTLAVFRRVLDEDAYAGTPAGIVLQAYLPDSLPALEELCRWARRRRDRGGAGVKVRLVKGANLAMERVDAELHGWPAAPFATKDETDANYKRMLDVLLDPANDGAVRLGVASHNVFEVAWAVTQAEARHRPATGSTSRCSRAWPRRWPRRPPADLAACCLYAPIVARGDIEAAIAYLVRRLDENSGPDNFLTHSFSLQVGSPAWKAEADRFRHAVALRHRLAVPTRRIQNRATTAGRAAAGAGFANEPDTDFSIAANREWITGHLEAVRKAGLPDYRPVVGGSNGRRCADRDRRGPERRRRDGLPLALGRPGPGGGGGGGRPGRGRRVGGDPGGGPAPVLEAAADGPGPPPGRATGGDGGRRRQDGPRGRSGGFGGDRLRHLLRRPHPRRRHRLSAPRHRGGGLAVELPAVDPGGRPVRRPGRRERRDLQARSGDGRHRRRAGRGALGRRGAPDRAAVRAVCRRRSQPPAHHPSRGRRGGVDRVVGDGPPVSGSGGRGWPCTPRPAARTPW